MQAPSAYEFMSSQFPGRLPFGLLQCSLHEATLKSIQKLQLTQNAAMRTVLDATKVAHATPPSPCASSIPVTSQSG